MWDAADEFGFLVLGRLAAEPKSWSVARSLQEHPSAFGWMIDQEVVASESGRDALAEFVREHPQMRLGALLETVVPAFWLAGLRFLACPEFLLADLSTSALPKLLWGTFSTCHGQRHVPNVPHDAAVLGWVQE
jgi:hypothetical protein